MNFQDFYSNLYEFNEDAVRGKFRRIFQYLVDNQNSLEFADVIDTIENLAPMLEGLESDDFFGTEGMDI